ncbi:MAG: TetR/AcrR family transcriptional regulator [Leptonema sp. (in: Bacteria)]|nr:TetR/AcrR family transcriptional regulator [Leptonema sp. (in: bacteria)]
MPPDQQSAAQKQRREAILDKIQQLVFERGFHNLSVDDFALAAQYTKRALYHYFKDKDEIFFALVARGLQILREKFVNVEANTLPGKEGAKQFIEAFYEFSVNQPQFFELWMHYESSRHVYGIGRSEGNEGWQECQNLSYDLLTILVKWLSIEKQEGRLKTELEALPLMLLFWGQTVGIMQILLMRRVGFENVYGISQRDFFNEFVDNLLTSFWK